MRNPKSKALNTKQAQMTKIQNSFGHLNLGFWISLEFRISDLEF